MTSWIDTVPYEDSTGIVREIYDFSTTPNGTVDDVHSLHP